MTSDRAHFEIKVDGIVRTHCTYRETAIVTARLLQQYNPGAKVLITDLRDGAAVPFEQAADRRK